MQSGSYQPGAVRGRLWGRAYVGEGTGQMKRHAHRRQRRAVRTAAHKALQMSDVEDADIFVEHTMTDWDVW